MALRDELVPLIDEARGVLDELGLRVRRVERVVRTWSGAEVGAGDLSDEAEELSPAPRVRQAPQKSWSAGGELAESAVRSEQILVDRVSASYESTFIQPALTASQELLYLVDGEPHQLISAEVRPFEWRLTLTPRLI